MTIAIKAIKAERKDGSFEQNFRNTNRTIDFKWTISGDTYDYRRTLKRCGLEYNGADKTWHWDQDELPDAVKGIIDALGGLTLDDLTDEITSDYEAPSAEDEEATQPDPPPKPEPQVNTGHLPDWFIPPTWWKHINLYIQFRPAVAIVGPAGNGKTTACEIALQAQNIDYLMLSCTDRTEVIDLVGGTVLTKDGEQWRDGLVTRAFKAGQAVILDEADALDPRVMMSLQTALLDPGPDGNARYVTVEGEKVYPADKCPILMTMNTVGSGRNRQYVGRNQLDAASLDRLTMIQTTYENEADMLQKRGVGKRLASRIVTWAEVMRNKIDDAGLPLVLSPRTMLRIAQCVDDFGWDFQVATELEFFSRIDPQDQPLLK